MDLESRLDSLKEKEKKPVKVEKPAKKSAKSGSTGEGRGGPRGPREVDGKVTASQLAGTLGSTPFIVRGILRKLGIPKSEDGGYLWDKGGDKLKSVTEKVKAALSDPRRGPRSEKAEKKAKTESTDKPGKMKMKAKK